MPETKNREVCPHCGQTINRRELVLTKTLVRALVDVYNWCIEHQTPYFTRKQVQKIFLTSGNETMTATFGDWIYFSSGLVFKQKRGSWGLHLERVESFLRGKIEISTRIAKRNGSKQIEVLETGTVFDVKGVSELLNTAGEFTINYRR